MQHPIRSTHPQVAPRPRPTTRNNLSSTQIRDRRLGDTVRNTPIALRPVYGQPHQDILNQTNPLNLYVNPIYRLGFQPCTNARLSLRHQLTRIRDPTQFHHSFNTQFPISYSLPVHEWPTPGYRPFVYPMNRELSRHSVHRVHIPQPGDRASVGGRAVVLDTHINVPVVSRAVNNLLLQLIETTRMTTIRRIWHQNQRQTDDPNGSVAALLLTLPTTSLTPTSIALLALLIRRSTLRQPLRNVLRITRIDVQLNRILTSTGCPRAKIRFPHPVTLLVQHPIRRIHPQMTPRPRTPTRQHLRGTKMIHWYRRNFVGDIRRHFGTVNHQRAGTELGHSDSNHVHIYSDSAGIISQPLTEASLDFC